MSRLEADLDRLAVWSEWVPFLAAVPSAPLRPGVYMVREGTRGPIRYVGLAGERDRNGKTAGKGLRGRLSVYASGKALASGLGEAVFDRALADDAWLAQRLKEVEDGHPMRATEWGRAAFRRVDLHVSWTVTADRAAAVMLEQQVLVLTRPTLWNRR